MKLVALDLDGPALVALGEHAARVAAVQVGGRVEERHAREELLRRLHVGEDLLRRLAHASGQARERDRGAHERQELPPVDARIDRDTKLALEVLAEVLGLEQLLEAPPVLAVPQLPEPRPRLGEARSLRRRRCAVLRRFAAHRWHVTQSVSSKLGRIPYSAFRRAPISSCRPAGHVAHREDGVARPQVLLGRAMAIEAPGHLERRVLRHERHPVDAPVAGLAPDSLGDVDRVVEVDVVGQVVDLDPLDRSAGPPALPDRLELGRLVPDLGVAVHARLGRRDVRERGLLDARVAVPAVDAHGADVVLVGELDRLDAGDALLRDVGRAVDGVEEPEQQRDEENGAEDRHPRNRVRAAAEDLSHGG